MALLTSFTYDPSHQSNSTRYFSSRGYEVYRICKETISFSKRKAKERRDELSALERDVKRWQDLCDESPTSENLTGLEETRIRYESAYDYVTQGAIIRSRARWFLRLENQNNSSSCIRKLKLDDEMVTTDPVEILGEIKSFYSTLYQSHGSNNESDISVRFLENPSLPKLDEDKKELCEGRLTYNECYRSLLTFQTGKAPGNDGLTLEFYKAFWPLLGNLVVDCLNEAYDYG